MNEIKRGTVLWFDRVRGIGWAMPDDLGADAFLHRRQLQPDRRYLNAGDRIEWQDGEFNGHPCAVNVRFTGRTIARQVSADKLAEEMIEVQRNDFGSFESPATANLSSPQLKSNNRDAASASNITSNAKDVRATAPRIISSSAKSNDAGGAK
jgi:cold shock CspA family protein